jgi:hypothetical protein
MSAPNSKPNASALRLLWGLPWRFSKRTRSADDGPIEHLSDGATASEWFFAGLVVLGVFGEFVIAARHPPYDSWLGQWGSAYVDLLIAGGIALETIASVIAHVCQNELTRRTSLSLEKALEDSDALRLKLDQTRRALGGRHITLEDMIKGDHAVRMRADKWPADIRVLFAEGDEVAHFATQIWSILALGRGKRCNGIRQQDGWCSDRRGLHIAGKDAMLVEEVLKIAGVEVHSWTRAVTVDFLEVHVYAKPSVTLRA